MSPPPARKLRVTLATLVVTGITGCASLLPREPSLVPTRHVLEVGPYRIATEVQLDEDSPWVRQLVGLQRDVESTLGVRPIAGQPPIEVNILADRAKFNHFLKYYYPELPARRAFFFAQGTRRVVYTYDGGRLEEDLRHEACHALLHGNLANLPLWLDEGLAEYFECPDGPGGPNREHLARWEMGRSEGFVPDLERLESLGDVRQMSPQDYCEAWAWVHYLLQSTPENRAMLLGYLSDLRVSDTPARLSQRLRAHGHGDTAPEALCAHIESLRTGRDTKTRLQNPSSAFKEATPAVESARSSRRRSLFGRALDLLGAPARLLRGRNE